MPKKTRYPKLRVHIKRGRAGQVWTSYWYDMRGTDQPDVPLGTDYAEALRKWEEIHERAPRIRGTLEEAFARWEVEEIANNRTEETQRGYRKSLRALRPVFGAATWDSIGFVGLKSYLKARTAKTQANRELALLSIIWRWAQGEGLTDQPWPAAGMEKARWKNPEGARTLTDDSPAAYAAIYACGDQTLRDCMDLATATGMRLTDCRTVLLPRGDVLRLEASKTGKKADFDLSLSEVLPDLVARRRAMKADHLMLLSTPAGKPVSARMLRDRFDLARLRARALAGIAGDCGDAAGYELAQAIAATWLRDGRKLAADAVESVEDAAQLLQHSSAGVTRKHYRTRAVKLKPVR